MKFKEGCKDLRHKCLIGGKELLILSCRALWSSVFRVVEQENRTMVKHGRGGFRSSGTNCLPAIHPCCLTHSQSASSLTLTQPGAKRTKIQLFGSQRFVVANAADSNLFFALSWVPITCYWRQRKRTLVNQRNACQNDAITPTATLDPLTDLSDSATPFKFTAHSPN